MNNAELSAFANPGSDQGPGSSGLTKREYFAAMALQGLLSNLNTIPNKSGYDYSAEIAVKVADELLKQLEK